MKHSSFYWMLFTWFCNARHSSFPSTSYLVFDFVHKFCCVTAHDEIFGMSLFLLIHCHKFTPFCRESALRTLQKRAFLPEEDSSRWGSTFCNVSPSITFRFPRSIVTSNRFSRILISIRLPSRVWWSWKRHDRRHPPCYIHQKSRFGCGTFFSWFLLSSFCHCSSANCGTEMANVITRSTHDSTHRVRNSFWSRCLRVGFWCRCIWFWFLGSRLIRSNGQSRATLWVLETCSHCRTSAFDNHFDYNFIVLKHMQHSFLTRGLDIEENRINVFHHIDFLVRFVFTIHRFLRSIWNTRNISKEQKQFDTIIPEQTNHPISVLCPERWFQILFELWETDVCFLHIQLMGTYVWLPKKHSVHTEVDFESSRSPEKTESWNSPNLHCIAVFPTWQYWLYSHVWWIFKNQSTQAFVTSFDHLWWIVRAYLLTIKYQVVQFLQSISISEQFENILVKIIQQILFLFLLKRWSSMHGVRYFVELLSRLVCQLTISFHTFLCMTSHVKRSWRNTKIWEW